MIDKISHSLFSFTGLSILIGCLGLLSGITTLFIDINALISVKFLLATVLFSAISIAILFKALFDCANETKPQPAFEHPFSYNKDDNILLIRRNDNFINSIVVGCYIDKNDMETLAFLGVVHHVQDKVIQVRLVCDFGKLKNIPSDLDSLKKITVRAVVPLTALEMFKKTEANNE